MRVNRISFLVAVFLSLLLSSLGTAQVSAQGMGRFSEWSAPVNLGPVVNSEFVDIAPAISPNGLSLYFASDRPRGFGGQDIWVSRRARLADPWGTPENLGPPINTIDGDGTPYLSSDEHWLYFSSSRPGGCGSSDLWLSWRGDVKDDFGWQPPANLGCIINSNRPDGGPVYFQEADTQTIRLYFQSSRGDGVGRFDIYSSRLRGDGVFGSAELVWELSSPQDDVHPSLRRDGLELFLQSNRVGSLREGYSDLWVSTRETVWDAWSTPMNLGTIVNTKDIDGGPALSADGTVLFFHSDRPGGYGDNDLYMAVRRRLDK